MCSVFIGSTSQRVLVCLEWFGGLTGFFCSPQGAPSFGIPHTAVLPWKRKTPLTVIFGQGRDKTKNVLDRITLCQGRMQYHPRCHLGSRARPVLSAGYQHIPGNLTPASSVAEYSGSKAPLTAPSAVHLTTCVSPNSQRRGLSVQA